MKQRLLTLAAALSISLTACEGSLPMGPTSDLETGEAGLSPAALIHTEVTINLEDLPTTGGDGVTHVDTYGEDEFTLVHSRGGFNSPGTTNPVYVGSKTLIPVPDGGVTSLTKDDGGVFDALSIDLAEAPFMGLGPAPVTFTGTKSDGSSVSETFTTNGTLTLQFKTFPASFTDLVSLSWTQDFVFPHQFDNIVLSFESSGPLNPTTKDQCKKRGFADFGFRNQGQCVRFVERNENAKDKR